MKEEQEWITTAEAARIIGYSQRYVQMLVAENKLVWKPRSKLPGSRKLVLKSSAEALVPDEIKPT